MKIKSALLFFSEKLGRTDTGAENDGNKKTCSKNL